MVMLERGTTTDPLVDSFGRQMESVRVSLTDRCNFRCTYCMPAEGLPWLPSQSVLTFDEIERLVRIFCEMGITEIRLTGGEPLLRPRLHELVGRLSVVPGLEDLSLTTNGVLLPKVIHKLVDAGLSRINVSLDTLDHARFIELTRRDALDQVLTGLEVCETIPQLGPIKVNAVSMPGMTNDEIYRFCELARTKPYIIRFLEYMPLDAEEHWDMSQVITGTSVKAIIEERYTLLSVAAEYGSTSQRFRFADGKGEIGFVNPVSEPFCVECNRLRLTADGTLRTCLFSTGDTDLRTLLRDGSSDDDIRVRIREAVSHKELKHRINEGKAFKRANRSMSQIGG